MGWKHSSGEVASSKQRKASKLLPLGKYAAESVVMLKKAYKKDVRKTQVIK